MQLVMVSILSLAIPRNAFAPAAQALTFRTGVTDIAIDPEGLDNKRSVENLLQSDFLLFDEDPPARRSRARGGYYVNGPERGGEGISIRMAQNRLEELRERHARAEAGGRPERKERQHREGKLSAPSGLTFCSTKVASKRLTSWYATGAATSAWKKTWWMVTALSPAMG